MKHREHQQSAEQESTPTEPEAADNIFNNFGDREVYTYSIAILVKGDAEGGTMMSAIVAFSTYHGMDYVGLVNGATLTGASYFRDMPYLTQEHVLPAAPTNQMSYGKSDKKEQLERVFASAALSIARPTAIYALLKFKEVRPTCRTKFDLEEDHPKLSIMRDLLNGVKGGSLFQFNMLLKTINFDILLKVCWYSRKPPWFNRGS